MSNTRKALRMTSSNLKTDSKVEKKEVYKRVHLMKVRSGDVINIFQIVNGVKRETGPRVVLGFPWASACEKQKQCNCKDHVLDRVLTRSPGGSEMTCYVTSETVVMLRISA